jgi:hypothetical protein
VGSSLNQCAAEFSLCNTLVLLLDLAFKQSDRNLTFRHVILLLNARADCLAFVSNFGQREKKGC